MSKKISKGVKKRDDKNKGENKDLEKSNLSNVLSFYDDLSKKSVMRRGKAKSFN